jgi:hypothetical protein
MIEPTDSADEKNILTNNSKEAGLAAADICSREIDARHAAKHWPME